MEHNGFASVEEVPEEGSRLPLDEIQNLFITDKLDLVFVIDSHPDMARFYKKQLFGQGFLDRFEPYDWRFAYTNMSVAPETVEQVTQEKAEEEEECAFFSSLFQTVFGVFSEGLRTTARGIEGIGQCISSIEWPDFSSPEFADGQFLPFEHKGKKWEPPEGNCLTPLTENHSEIFDNSFRLNQDESEGFDAPILMEEDQKSHPMPALLFSFVKGVGGVLEEGSEATDQDEQTPSGLSPEEPSSAAKTCQPFFRQDSVIVYVVITVNDIQSDTLLEEFQENFGSVLSASQRLKIIPVTVGPRSILLCGLSSKTRFSASPKLRKLARQTGSAPLDLCSKNLPDQLFEEITKSLYTADF